MIVETLTSPVILFFILGFLAAVVRSDLTIPEPFAKAMSIYLMAAIGLKGGVEVASTGFTIELATAAAAGLALMMGMGLVVRFRIHDAPRLMVPAASLGSANALLTLLFLLRWLG